jgi:hypothetical protein
MLINYFKNSGKATDWALTAVLTAVLGFALVMTLGGCPQPTDDSRPASTNIKGISDGEYRSAAVSAADGGFGADSYIIKNGTLSYFFDGVVSFKGALASYESGVAIIKISETGEYGPALDSFYGVYLNSALPFSFSGANAYKAGGKNKGAASLEEALKEYTDTNGYFDFKGDYGFWPGPASISPSASGRELILSLPVVQGAASYELYCADEPYPPPSPGAQEKAAIPVPVQQGAKTVNAKIDELENGRKYWLWARPNANTSDVPSLGAWVYLGSGQTG